MVRSPSQTLTGNWETQPSVGTRPVLPLKRYRRKFADSVRGVTNPSIRRLARRGGVQRMSSSVYDEIRDALRARLTNILYHAIEIATYRGGKATLTDGSVVSRGSTIMTRDVLYALKCIGEPIYGFDDPEAPSTSRGLRPNPRQTEIKSSRGRVGAGRK